MEQTSGTVSKAADLLFALHEQTDAIGVTALARRMQLPKSSVHRLLAALRARALVERDERGRYRLGHGLVALGVGVLDRDPVVSCARGAMAAAVAELGETLFLVGGSGGQLRVLDKCEGAGLLRAAPRIGAAIPVHCTAVGRLHLAHEPSGFPLERVAAAADLEAAPLRARVELARARGWDSSFGEWQEGLSVLAAPIIVRERLHAAVALGAPSGRLAALGGEAAAPRVVAVANIIAARLAGEHLTGSRR